MEKTIFLSNSSRLLQWQAPVNLTSVKQNISLGELTAAKQSTLFKSLKQGQFSGKLIFTDTHKTSYTFFLYLGRVIYATGGIHPIRRWQRLVRCYCQDLTINLQNLEQEWLSIAENYQSVNWEYGLLDFWLKQEKISREQFLRIVKSSITEILFDLSQASEVSYQLDSHTVTLSPAVFLDVELSIVEAWKQSQAWIGAKLGNYSPNCVPKLKEYYFIQNIISEEIYNLIAQSLEKEKTIREIATQSGQNFVNLTQSLAVYIQRSAMYLEEIEDLPSPIKTEYFEGGLFVNSKYAVACISQDPQIVKILQQTVIQAGHQFYNVPNQLEAVALFMRNAPSFIFLDINDYELSSQLHKLKPLQNIPIVMLTWENNLSTILKARLSGCRDILTKPIQPHNVLHLLSKHLI